MILYNHHNGKNNKLSSVDKDMWKILISDWWEFINYYNTFRVKSGGTSKAGYFITYHQVPILEKTCIPRKRRYIWICLIKHGMSLEKRHRKKWIKMSTNKRINEWINNSIFINNILNSRKNKWIRYTYTS